LPEEFVRDLVEYYYSEIKAGMFIFSHVIFSVAGLGKFKIRPIKFFRRETIILKLIDRFKDSRSDRGGKIRMELEKRYQEMLVIKPEVQKQFDHRQKKIDDKRKKKLERLSNAE
jgi:hypothetical protein